MLDVSLRKKVHSWVFLCSPCIVLQKSYDSWSTVKDTLDKSFIDVWSIRNTQSCMLQFSSAFPLGGEILQLFPLWIHQTWCFCDFLLFMVHNKAQQLGAAGILYSVAVTMAQGCQGLVWGWLNHSHTKSQYLFMGWVGIGLLTSRTSQKARASLKAEFDVT